MEQKRAIPHRMRIGAAVIPVILFGEMAAFGANGAFLGAAGAFAAITGAMLVLVLTVPDGRFWPRAAPVLITVAAALIWVALPGLVPGIVPGSVRLAPDLLLPGMARLFGGVALLLAGAWIGYRRGLMRAAIRWIVVLVVLDIVIGLALRHHDPARVWGMEKTILGDRFTGTLLNANSSACFFGVLVILALGALLALVRDRSVAAPRTADQVQMVFYVLTIIAGVGACAITGSRTALGLIVILVPLMVLADPVARRLALSWQGLIAAVVGAVAIAMVGVLVGDLTIERLSVLGSNGEDRIETWRFYTALAKRAPWTGYGPLAFDEANAQALRTLADAQAQAFIHSPHNAILSLVIAGGIPYAGLLGLAAGMILFRITRGHRSRRPDPIIRAALLAALFIAGCAMVDIQLDVPAMSGLAIVLLAMPWGRAIRIAADERPRRARPQP